MSTREEAARAPDDADDEAHEESDAASRLALIAGSGSDDDEPLEPESDTDAGVDPEIEQQESLADDSSRCGDGRLDETEMCDIGIPSGHEGACPTRCNPEPGCPTETMVVRSCWSYCVPDEAPPPECED